MTRHSICAISGKMARSTPVSCMLRTASAAYGSERISLSAGQMGRGVENLFGRLGAQVTALNAAPNGRNINLNSGALHVEGLRDAVLAAGADLGVAFDGDADRAIFVAASGKVVNGDAVLLAAGRALQADGRLPGNTVVSTVMSNLGLEKAF